MNTLVARRLTSALTVMFWAVLIAGVSGIPAPAVAQVAVSKDLCLANNGQLSCVSQGALPAVPPNTQVTFPISVINPSGQSVVVHEDFPPGFVLTGSTCGAANPPLSGPGGSTDFGPLPAGQTNCALTGYFIYSSTLQNTATNSVTVYAAGDTQHANLLGTSNTVNAAVDGASPIPTDVSVSKTGAVVGVDGDGTMTVHYTISITNNGQNDVYGFLLEDRLSLPATGVPLVVSYASGSSSCTATGSSICFGQTPSIANGTVTVASSSPADFLQWSYPSGTAGDLRPGDSMTISYDVTLSPLALGCIRDPLGNALVNTAHISFNPPGSTTTVQDTNPANNTVAVTTPITIDQPVLPDCGLSTLDVTKVLDTAQPANGFAWGSTLGYTITIHNPSATQTMSGIRLSDQGAGLGDSVAAGVGTPPFTATLISWTCGAGICSNIQPAAGTAQVLAGYGDHAWMFGTDIYAPPSNVTLGPGDSVSFQLQLKYSNPGCDSYPAVALKPVLNYVTVAYHDSVTGDQLVTSAPALAQMAATAPCVFTTTKSANGHPSKIVFGPPGTTYTVKYSNPGTQVVTAGTLIDSLRIVQPAYATQLPVDYSYSCSVTAGTVAGYPPSGSGSLTVVHTSLPQQGVRVIENTGPVTFQPHSTLTCAVTVIVNRPAPSDPHCARVGELQNAAIMDTSAFYDPNLAWPADTGSLNASSAALPLPQCLNLVVNKSVQPIWATQGGAPQNNVLGPLAYTLTVSNLGQDAITWPDEITLGDSFPAGYAAASSTSVCTPANGACQYNWNPAPTSNPSTLDILALDPQQSIVTTFPLSGPFPEPPAQFCNDAQLLSSPTPHPNAALPANAPISPNDVYLKDPSTWQTHLCVPIFVVRPLDINKAIEIVPPANMPTAPVNFTVNATCTYPSNGIGYVTTPPVGSFTYTIPLNPATQTWNYIPVGSDCLIAEQTPSPAFVPMSTCPSGYGAWGPPAYNNPMSAAASPASQHVTIVTSEPNRFQVVNTFACAPPAQFHVQKQFDPPSLATQLPATSVFPVQLACPAHAPVVQNMTAPNYDTVFTDVPIGISCTITELPPTGTETQANCHWVTSYPNGQHQTFNGVEYTGYHIVNRRDCTGTINVIKTFDPPSLAGQLPANAVFPVQFACAGYPAAVFNLSAANQFHQTSAPLPVGTSCTVTEQPPVHAPLAPGCQWTTSYPKGQTGTIPNGAGSLVVQNSKSCGPLDLGIVKTGPTPIGGGLQTFTLTVTNLGSPFSGAGNVTMSDVQTGMGGTLAGISAVPSTDWSCPAVTATTAGCSYIGTATVPQGAVFGTITLTYFVFNASPYVNCATIGFTPASALQDVDLSNNMSCRDVHMDPNKAALTFTKTVSTQLPWIPPLPVFPVALDCQPNGPSQTLQLSANSGPLLVGNVPVGSSCTVTEAPPALQPPVPANCSWVPTIRWGGASHPNGSAYPNVQILQPVPDNIEVHNELVCSTPTGSLTVTKTVTNTAPGTPPAVSFSIDVDCTPAGPHVTLPPLQAGGATTVGNIPDASTCTVTEPAVPPAVIFPACPALAWWAYPPAYSPAQSVIISASGPPQAVTVGNSFSCNLPPTGALTVKKTASLDGLPPPPAMTFSVQVSCTPPFGAPTTQTLTMGSANQYQQTLGNLYAGTQCSIVEVPPPNIFNPPSHWVTTYPAGQQVTIQPGTQMLEVHNEQSWATVPANKAQLTVAKELSINGGLDNSHTTTAQVTLICGSLNNGAPQTVSLTPSIVAYQQGGAAATYYAEQVFAVTPGDSCTVSEPTLPPMSNNLVQAMCSWVPGTPSYRHGDDAGFAAGGSVTAGTAQHIYQLIVTNEMTCPPGMVVNPGGGGTGTETKKKLVCPAGSILRGDKCVAPPACKKPLVLDAAGACACPQGTVPRGKECVKPPPACASPMVANASGACACPKDTVQRGKDCVKPPPACAAPLVANASGACACPKDTVQRGKDCVKPPPACAAPMVANAAGACACPAGTVQQGKDCVKPPAACASPMLPNAAGVCACPKGTVQQGKQCVKAPPVCAAPLLPNAAGACVCPEGTVQQGKQCVKAPPRCASPLLPNAAGACVCPEGTVQQGKQCVKAPPVCASPMLPNAAGACACPAGMVLRGKDCVKPSAACLAPMVPTASGGCACPEGSVQFGKDCAKPSSPSCASPMLPDAAGNCACPEGTVPRGKDCVKPSSSQQPDNSQILKNGLQKLQLFP